MQRTEPRHFGTMTELLTRDEAGPAEPPRARPPTPVHVWGEGRPLAETVFFPGRPLSPRHEQMIRERLGRLMATGREARIQDLIDRIRRASLPAALTADLLSWAEQFAKINPALEEHRVFALAILLIRVIHPSLLKRLSREDQDLLLLLDGKCREIIQSMLPKEVLVEAFIQRCQEGLQDKALFQEQQERGDLLDETEILKAASHAIDLLIDEAYASLRARIDALQARRDEMHHIEAHEVEELTERVNQLREPLMRCAERLKTVEDRARDSKEKWLASLAECKTMLKGLL